MRNFLSRQKRYGFKDLLLGKWSIPKSDKDFDDVSDEGKKNLKIIELHEIPYTELILSIDVKTSNRKKSFNLVKGCKSKDYLDGNTAIPWERLKNKYNPISAPSVVKLEEKFREFKEK